MNKIFFQIITTGFGLLIGNCAHALGGYLYCEAVANTTRSDTSWKYAGEAPEDFLKEYGVRNSKDGQSETTVENDSGATFIYTKSDVVVANGGPVAVAGYSPNSRSDAIQGDYLTFPDAAQATAFCEGLRKICQKLGDDYIFMVIARGNNGEFWGKIAINYYDGVEPNRKIFSGVCPNEQNINFPNKDGYAGPGVSLK